MIKYGIRWCMHIDYEYENKHDALNRTRAALGRLYIYFNW